jgi:hypothetical protein
MALTKKKKFARTSFQLLLFSLEIRVNTDCKSEIIYTKDCVIFLLVNSFCVEEETPKNETKICKLVVLLPFLSDSYFAICDILTYLLSVVAV